MSSGHLANLAIHVAGGIAGILLGFFILARDKGTSLHRRLGRWFAYATLVVTGSAFSGVILFRFLPLFTVLAVLVLYQLVGGWRAATTRERGPQLRDAGWTLLAGGACAALAPIVLARYVGPPVILYSSLGTLGVIICYDALRFLFPRHWFARVWRYEHGYKMISSLFAMLSAFAGNVIRVGQPWSQLLPSIAGLLVIGYFFARFYREDSRSRAAALARFQ